ncbi:MAG: hypothetical protein NTW29_06310 [Bacteroidetes bacterium]|nr:hypothetical protein [Bacteroidota bacterium]
MSPGQEQQDKIPLFDRHELKVRKADSAYIIYHPASWAEYHPTLNPCNCPYSDTVAIYVFDKEGRVVQEINFVQLGDYGSGFQYDSTGKSIARISFRKEGARRGYVYAPYLQVTDSNANDFRTTIVRQKDGTDSLITHIHFSRFQHGSDTAFVTVRRYNAGGQLIAIQSSVNARNKRELCDDTGEFTYHFTYAYDSAGRLTYKRNMREDKYTTYSYFPWGRISESRTAATGELLSSYYSLREDHKGGKTITDNNRLLILSPLEKNSKLFGLKTVVTSGEVPLVEYYEIVYKYR